MAVATNAARADIFATLINRNTFLDAGRPAYHHHLDLLRYYGGIFSPWLQPALVIWRPVRAFSWSEQIS
jgi:hypothetical protein